MPPGAGRASRAARAALVVLTLINLFNYLDRYVVASLVESLKKSELSLSDTQAGSLMTGFVIVYMLTSPIFGTLGDRRRRPPRLALALLCLWLKDPPRGAQDEPGEISPPARDQGEGVGAAYSRLWRNRSYRLTVLGYAAYTFALGGLAFWAPAFLERIRGMSKGEATVQFGAIVVVTGFVGTFAGGWAGDYFLRKSRNAYLTVSGWVTLAAAPVSLVA